MTFCERLGKILRDRNCEIENESDYLSSAVLVPLVRREGRLGVLFEVRSTALTWQPGDICFPGGRIELDDAGPEAAAVQCECAPACHPAPPDHRTKRAFPCGPFPR